MQNHFRITTNHRPTDGANRRDEMSEYRIENKQNIVRNGKKTLFHLYQKSGDAFVHEGTFTAIGHNASDTRCIAEALNAMDRIESAAQYAQ